MSRRFDGVDDEVRYPIQVGISDFVTTATYVKIFRPRVINSGFRMVMGEVNAAGTVHSVSMEWNGINMFWEVNESGTVGINFDGTAGRPPLPATTDWCFVAWSKTSGISTPRLHWKNLTAGTAMIHINAATTTGDPNTPGAGSIRIGEWRDSDDADENVAVDAAWGVVLTDLQIESLVANSRTQDFLDLHATVPGAFCHQHNQAVATDDIEDLFGNGHVATGTITSTSDTSGIQGTAMDTTTDPPSWTYYSATLPNSNTGYGDGTYGDGTYGVRSSPDNTPPTVNVTTGTGKISDETGKDSYAYSFTVDEAVQAWEVRVVPNASDPRGSGTLVESGGAASGTISGSITYAELNAAGQGTEGQKILKFFAQDTAGNWST